MLAGLTVSCSRELRPVRADAAYYHISGAGEADSSVLAHIQPYHDSLASDMQEVIATSAMPMEKGKPESLLGNFIADLLLEKGKNYFGDQADFCVMNYGGLRTPLLPAGAITRGMIYELMPFDNFLVLMELNGHTVQQMLDHIASDGGWPMAGIKFKIGAGKALDIFINQLPLQPDKIYRVLTSDYLADGGDNLFMLRGEKRINAGIFIRDVILDYLREQTKNGKTISSRLDYRIIAE